ncbi:hypothetical protein [Streptomyces sp. KLOTTS4A1]|uniref:hypothetical protein n=1 Tax=Streptomyces sp. KLOTTS4A1 TaxID=3390996 RepID=UPI0039F56695
MRLARGERAGAGAWALCAMVRWYAEESPSGRDRAVVCGGSRTCTAAGGQRGQMALFSLHRST